MEELNRSRPVDGDMDKLEPDEELFDGEDPSEAPFDDEQEDELDPREENGKTVLWETVKKKLPRVAIFARYLLPAVFGVVLLITAFFDGVYFYMNGKLMKTSLVSFYKNTLTSAHGYLAGTTDSQTNLFYGLMAGGALVFALIYLLALGLSALAAVTACRAFLSEQDGERCNRAKVIFKIAFPNRVLLYLSGVLYFVPSLYPQYFSAVGKRFLAIGGRETVFVDRNGYLIATLIYAAVLAVLSLAISKWERREKMNMFLVTHSDEETEDEDEEE